MLHLRNNNTIQSNVLSIMDPLARAAGVVMHLDVNNLVSANVIKDKTNKGNNATLYNTAGTALSGIVNTDSRIKSMVNLLGNAGNMDGSVAWTSVNATNAQVANELLTTGNGTSTSPRSQKGTAAVTSGDTIYACAYFKHSAAPIEHYLSIRDGSGGVLYQTTTISSPGSGVYKFTSLINQITSSTTSLFLLMQVRYVDFATANGKVMTNKKAHVINLTAIVANTGITMPTQAQMDAMMQAHYDTGGAYIGATPLGSSYVLKACKKYDGTDDYGRVLAPSPQTNITTEQFALGCVIQLPATGDGYVLCRNTADTTSIQYALSTNTDMSIFLNGVKRLSSPAITRGVWYSFIIHRDTSGNLSIIQDGAVVATGTYTNALTTASNLILGSRYNGSTGVFGSNGYINHEFIAVGPNATIANVKAFQRSHALNYVASYAS